MISNYEVMMYLFMGLSLIYFGKKVNWTKNGIISTIIATIVVGVVIYLNSGNNIITKEKYINLEKELKLRKWPFLTIEPRIIKILKFLIDFKRNNSSSFYRILRLSNSFFKNYHIIYHDYKPENHRHIENSIIISKKILNELSSLIVSAPTHNEYEFKLTEATKKVHNILNNYISKMVEIHKDYWKGKKINNTYSPIFLENGPYPNDTETEYYSENFNLY